MVTQSGRPLVVELYCGRGGVGMALDDLPVEYVGVDRVDHGETYPGRFIRADASQPPLDVDADLVWASPPCTAYSDLSPSYYGSREAALRENPTIPDLDVREVCQQIGDHYVIENVPGASRHGHLRDPTRLNGLGFGEPYGLERHFETSFPCPDVVDAGEPEITVSTRDDDDQSVAALAEAKGVPSEWGKKGVRSAIPRCYVYWLLSHAPLDVEVPRPTPPQQRLGGTVA